MVSATTQKYLRVSSQTWSGKNWSNQTWPGQTWVMRILAVLACIMYPAWPNALAGGPVHGIAMHGAPQLAPDFPHLPYASATAPKGGRITLGVFGTFDSLNPLIIRGVAPPDIRGLVYESLMARNGDEPFSLYGLIAETVEVPDDRSAITFHINPLARFSDGKPVLADDVAFSFHLLAKKGRPYMRSHYSKVASADVLGRHSIRFTFKASAPAHGGPAAPDREMPLIMGLMPVLPRHAIDPETFDRPGTAIPTGSGPYLVRNVTGGASLSFIRNKDYWARDLPIRRGIYNFDEIRMRYYRDGTAQFQAFKAGIVDLRWETDPSRWIAGYDIPIINKGRAKKYAFPTNLPAGMTGLVLNTRRPQFADPRVRRALMLAFDSRRINKQLFHDRYERTESYFARSSLASTGKPATTLERKLLAPFPGAVRPEVMAGTWRVPATGNDPGNRKNLRKAFELLKSAGYALDSGQLKHTRTGALFAIQFLVLTRQQARVVVVFAENLKRLGISTEVRQLDDTNYWSRIGTFDFDIIQWSYPASLSPGNEQINRWASAYAGIERSLNYAGVKNPAVDAMIDEMLTARDRTTFEAAVRAFDRVMLSGDYVIPLYHLPELWIAASSRLKFAKQQPAFGTDIHLWWVKPQNQSEAGRE